jgi:PKD repeat protein
VTFSDASTGGPTSWAWDFGDGTTSTVQSPPAHTYSTAATYTVSLIASNSSGPSAPATKTITVSSAPPPPPPGSNPIKTMTFEGTSLTDPVTGADSVTGALTRETTSPILGSGSVGIPNLASGYLQEGFTAVPDLFVAFDLRLTARPSTASRILLVSDQGTTVGNLQLLPTGQLRLRNVSTTIGVDSTALVVGTVYRVAIHQRQGTGSNALLEAFLAPAGNAFGSPFATLTTGAWTTLADRIRFGATAGGALDATADNIALDAGAMPTPSVAVVGAATFVVAATYQAPVVARTTGMLFDCMIPLDSGLGPQAQVTPLGLGLGEARARGQVAV